MKIIKGKYMLLNRSIFERPKLVIKDSEGKYLSLRKKYYLTKFTMALPKSQSYLASCFFGWKEEKSAWNKSINQALIRTLCSGLGRHCGYTHILIPDSKSNKKKAK